MTRELYRNVVPPDLPPIPQGIGPARTPRFSYNVRRVDRREGRTIAMYRKVVLPPGRTAAPMGLRLVEQRPRPNWGPEIVRDIEAIRIPTRS